MSCCRDEKSIDVNDLRRTITQCQPTPSSISSYQYHHGSSLNDISNYVNVHELS